MKWHFKKKFISFHNRETGELDKTNDFVDMWNQMTQAMVDSVGKALAL